MIGHNVRTCPCRQVGAQRVLNMSAADAPFVFKGEATAEFAIHHESANVSALYRFIHIMCSITSMKFTLSVNIVIV